MMRKEKKTGRQTTIYEQGLRHLAEDRKRIITNRMNSLARHLLQEETEQFITITSMMRLEMNLKQSENFTTASAIQDSSMMIQQESIT